MNEPTANCPLVCKLLEGVGEEAPQSPHERASLGIMCLKGLWEARDSSGELPDGLSQRWASELQTDGQGRWLEL